MDTNTANPFQPEASPAALQGIKVVEMGQLIAGPFCGKTLGEFGAEVIKIEATGTGDPLRNWRLLQDGTSVWWRSWRTWGTACACGWTMHRRWNGWPLGAALAWRCGPGARRHRARTSLPPM